MNPNDPFNRLRFSVKRISGWQIALVVALALAVGTALALVAASVFLVVFPVMVLSGLAYRLFGGRKPVARARAGVTVIDAEYRVLSPDEIAHDAPPRPRARPGAAR